MNLKPLNTMLDIGCIVVKNYIMPLPLWDLKFRVKDTNK